MTKLTSTPLYNLMRCTGIAYGSGQCSALLDTAFRWLAEWLGEPMKKRWQSGPLD
jgi:hypothetical protein